MGQNSIFQDDNARPHRASIVDDFLQLNGVQRLELPPMSLDLSCIEHLWDILGRAVNKNISKHTRLTETSSSRMGCNSSKANTVTGEFDEEES